MAKAQTQLSRLQKKILIAVVLLQDRAKTSTIARELRKKKKGLPTWAVDEALGSMKKKDILTVDRRRKFFKPTSSGRQIYALY